MYNGISCDLSNPQDSVSVHAWLLSLPESHTNTFKMAGYFPDRPYIYSVHTTEYLSSISNIEHFLISTIHIIYKWFYIYIYTLSKYEVDTWYTVMKMN